MINKRYIVSKKLGEGRSKVFSVIDTEFPEREVAAKFLPASSSNEEREIFREEYFTLQKLDHPNIIKSFELNLVLVKDEDEDHEIEKFSYFITMESFSGQSLLDYSGLIEEKKLNQIIKQICSALYFLHQSNYIYYDLKAENILVAEQNGNPVIKIIDLGFARHIITDNEKSIQGTPYYIAPELLKNETHDYRVDFYSLGILLYKIVYGKFPFEGDNELDIYKSHIEGKFVFDESIYSKKLINVIEKLLKKNPEERYKNALQIILDLQLPIDFEIVKDFVPAKVFSNRKDALNILKTYLNDKVSNEVFSVTGFDGSGKTSLALEIYRRNPLSVFIENSKTKTGFEAVKYIVHKIVLTEAFYLEREDEFAEVINDLFGNSSSSFVKSVKRIFNILPDSVNLTIIFDDYNLYDSFTKESLTEIIRIFQVKGIKVILTESSDFDYASSSLFNVCPIQLNQFTDQQLSEFLDLSYYKLYPIKELKKYISLYSDLQPGNVKQFIKDLILISVIKFDNGEVTFHITEDIVLALQSSHAEIYRMRLSNLNANELKLAQIISAFDISVEQTVLAALLNVSHEMLRLILKELEKKNIIDPLSLSNAPKINSFNFKKYIYSTISNRKRFHLVLANSIEKLFADFNVMELARQFELAGDFEQSVKFMKKEILLADEISAFAYKRSLLEKVLEFDIQSKELIFLKYELVKTLFKLSDFKVVLENLNQLNLSAFSLEEKDQLLFIKGSSLIGLRKLEEGESILSQLHLSTKDQKLKHQTLAELAYAEFDFNNINEAEAYCKLLLEIPDLDFEVKGKCYNLLGLIEIQNRNNPQEALKAFNNAMLSYEKTNLTERVVGIKINIGNILHIVADKNNAEKYWDDSIELNKRVGHLEQEGRIYLNYGVFYLEENNFEKSLTYSLHAQKIFSTLGILNDAGLATENIGEMYLKTCDYQNAFFNLTKAVELFSQIRNIDEQLNTFFMLGKFWFTIGETEELKMIVNQYEYFLLLDENKSEKSDLNYSFLKYLLKINTDSLSNYNAELISMMELAIKISENELYIELIFLSAEQLLKLNKFDEAFNLLLDKDFIKFIENNIIYKAQREFLLGKIAYFKQDGNLKSPMEYFESAYSLIENESITELTWKILFTIAETYWERGNFHKAKKPSYYAYELITMIGDNISNNKIRTAYFNHPERKKALEKLVIISNQTKLNEFQRS